MTAIADGLQLAPESARKHSERALSSPRAGASDAGNRASIIGAGSIGAGSIGASSITASSIGADPSGAPVSGDPIRGFLWALAFVAPLWVWLSVWLLT